MGSFFPFAFECIQFHGASRLFTADLRVAKHRFYHRRCGEINIKRFEIYEVEKIKKEKKKEKLFTNFLE